MKRCRYCNRKIHDDAAVCPFCHKSLGAETRRRGETGRPSSQSPPLASSPLKAEPIRTGSASQSEQHKRVGYLLALTMLAVLLVWGLNHLLVGRPVQAALRGDARNGGYSVSAHYRYYLDPSTLVLDLRGNISASPTDLFRGLFQSAEALHKSGRKFKRVILARRGTSVFVIKGEEFLNVGAEYGSGQNPVYLVRTLPEELYRMSGEAAFGRWEGGLLGVFGKQMEDVNQAAQQWVEGK
jgi:hypothetical protein